MKKRFLRAASTLFLATAAGFGQKGPASPAFEVASIKPAPPFTWDMLGSPTVHQGLKVDKALADFGGLSLTNLVSLAYRVRPYQVSGPDWMNAARFDILAKLPEGASTDSVPEMLQALLADRFKLTLHRDSREFPVYALVVGKGGSKLTPKPADYDPAAQGSLRPMKMETYAALLTDTVDRPVVDQTGLEGEYMISRQQVTQARATQAVRLKATELQQLAALRGGSIGVAPDPPESDTFVAVQALGLKLEPRKLPLALLVIDHLEKTPTEN